MDLFDNVPPGPEPVEPMNDKHRKYLIWREANPDVLKIIKEHCWIMYQKKRRFGVRMVLEYVRFNEFFSGYRDEPYRINDHHCPYIARELIEEEPGIEEFIETRVCQGEEEAQEQMDRNES